MAAGVIYKKNRSQMFMKFGVQDVENVRQMSNENEVAPRLKEQSQVK